MSGLFSRLLIYVLAIACGCLKAEVMTPWPYPPPPTPSLIPAPPSQPLCSRSSGTYKRQFGGPDDVIQIEAEVFQTLCKVTAGIPTIGQDTRRISLENKRIMPAQWRRVLLPIRTLQY